MKAFTLIELLVVVTVIVTLLALLTPALDRAIYQAELVVCAANKGALGTAVITYAHEHKRHYPYRQHLANEYSVPLIINYTLFGSRMDDRPMLRPYVSINKLLNDPLSEEVELEAAGPDVITYAGYNLWFSMQYRPDQGFWDKVGPEPRTTRGMFRLGDRWEWEDRNYGEKPVRSNVMANDRYLPHPKENAVHSSHPGDGWVNLVKREEPYGIELKATISMWEHYNAPQAGAIDMNALFDDGSVRRYNDVKWDPGGEPWVDERFVRSPAWNFSSGWTSHPPYGEWWEVTPRS
jgi:prepilin-type N-terminal cleavage/methylation domain-containing protein